MSTSEKAIAILSASMRALICLVIFAVASARAAEDPVALGRTLVEENCSQCHATGPDGDSPFAPAPPFRILDERYPVEDLEEALAEGILSGHPAMPEFTFEPDQIGAIIRYLKSIQQE